MVDKSRTFSLEFQNVTVHYGDRIALDSISFQVPRNSIFSIIGPANSGKTTLLKCINRTLELIPAARQSGAVYLDGVDTGQIADVYQLRRRIGMVFPLPVGLPLSIYDNVAYGPRRARNVKKSELDACVERCLKLAMLWDEVKDRLDTLGTKLSGGQQQRLTLARALAHEPEILCLDEFSIAIDPITTMRIEQVLKELKHQMTIVMVTNLTQQALRLADNVMFLNASRLIEVGSVQNVFHTPQQSLTHDYITGLFG
jgi:phosphate transport system ATP-binding protein